MTQKINSLVRGLGLGSTISVVAGSVIGSGVFLVAADIGKELSSPWLALGVWLVAGLISLVGGLTFAELGAAFPGAGGQYVYLREAFGPLAGFLFGWTWILIVQPGSIAAVSIAVTRFAAELVPMSPVVAKILAIAVIVLFTCANLFGVKRGAKLLDAMTALKVLALVAIVLVGLIVPGKAGFAVTGETAWTFSQFGVGLIAAFWAYDGWNNVTFVAGEVKNPQRNLPLALFLGLSGVTLLYVLVNYAYYAFLPAAQVASSSFVAGDAAQVVLGQAGLKIIVVAVVLSAMGCVNGMVLAGARVTYAMAADGTLPQALSYVHPRYHVPTTALAVQMIVSVILALSGRYDQLFTYVICAAFLFYALTAAAVLVLRAKRPELKRPYRVPLYPYLPLAYIVFTILFVANAFYEKPLESLVGLGIVVSGLPAFYGYRAIRRRVKMEPLATEIIS